MSQDSAAARARAGANASRDPLRTAAAVVGAVFLVVGVLGFIPGITTSYSDLSFAGHNSAAKLLGIFQVSVLHNVVHLLFWLYGLVVGPQSSANFVPVNTADDWLHFLLGLGMIGAGVALSRRPAGAVTAR